jgi:hypothetical protein
MSRYILKPRVGHITVVPLKSTEIREYTGKVLSEVETSGHDVLQYGRVIAGTDDIKQGLIAVYPKLASDKTNFGDPRQSIVEIAQVKAFIEEVK